MASMIPRINARSSSRTFSDRAGRSQQPGARASTALACALLASVGAVSSLALAVTTNVVSSGTWLIPTAIAAVVVVLIAPVERVMGWAAALSIAAAFTASANTAPLDIQAAGRLLTLGLLTISLLRAGGERRKRFSEQKSTVAGFVILLAASWALEILLVSTVSGSSSPISVVLRWGGAIATLAVTSLFTRHDLCTFLRALIGFAIVESVLVYIDHLVRDVPVWGYRVLVTGSRPDNSILGTGFFRSQGAAGHAILLAFIVAIGMVCVWIEAARVHRIIALLASSAFVGVVLLSGTRSVVLALLGALGYLLVLAAPTFGRRAANTFTILTVTLLLFSNQTVQRYLGSLGEAFADSGSYSHRAGALESVPELLTELPLEQVLLGGGSGVGPSLYTAGYLQQDGLEVVDNQFVSTFIESGLIGTALFLILVSTAVIQGSKATRALIILAMTMFASFDFFLWPGPTYFLFALLGVAVMRPTERVQGQADGLERPAVIRTSRDRRFDHTVRITAARGQHARRSLNEQTVRRDPPAADHRRDSAPTAPVARHSSNVSRRPRKR